VGHSYALPVIKLLFATARTCAYPDCTIPLVFIDEERDVREFAVQIAHIRSSLGIARGPIALSGAEALHQLAPC
jgi:hypothetical protein